MREHVPVLTIYLDANVLISASLSSNSRFLDLWKMRTVTCITSSYAVDEVTRNLDKLQLARFTSLMANTQLCLDPGLETLPITIQLVTKDRPILAAALAAKADYLLTGDKRHFSHLYGLKIQGTIISSPAAFLAQHMDRLPLRPLT